MRGIEKQEGGGTNGGFIDAPFSVRAGRVHEILQEHACPKEYEYPYDANLDPPCVVPQQFLLGGKVIYLHLLANLIDVTH